MDRKSVTISSRPAASAPALRPGFAPGSIGDEDDDDLLGGYAGAVAEPEKPTAATVSPPRFAGRRWTALAAGGLLIAILVIAVLAYQLGSGSHSTAAPAVATAGTTKSTAPTSLPATDIYQLVAPSVVLITTAKGSLGTGVVVTATGTVMTANHVISDGSAVSLVFADGTKSTAVIAAQDATTDIATLTPATLPEVVVPATLGGGIAVGADVVAIGNPLGFTESTSSGIVSGLNRTATTKAGKFSGLIQFDAAVNPGSSGGPLLNAQGLVVGIVVSIANAADDDSFAGIGFAVPIGSALSGASGSGDGGGPQI